MKTFPQNCCMLREALHRLFSLSTLIPLLFLFCWQSVFSQLSVTEHLSPTPHPVNIYTFTNNLPALDVRHPPATSDPFYWTFWIFGDGEYFPPLKRGNPPPPFCWDNYLETTPITTVDNWLYNQDHTYYYTNSAGFIPIAVALDRKGDIPDPHDNLIRTFPTGLPGVGTIIPNAATLGDFSQESTIPIGKRIYLAHSHGYLNYHDESEGGGARSVFVISYRPPECMEERDTGKVYLFVGSAATFPDGPIPDPPVPTTIAPSDHLRFSNSILPEYYNPQYYPDCDTAVTRELVASAPHPFSRQLQFSFFNNYARHVRYRRFVPSSRMGSFEFRLFQEVQFEAPFLDANGNSLSYALAILTNKTRCGGTGTLSEDVSHILTGIDGVESTDGVYTYNGEYIVDVDTMYLLRGEPHDPNRIFVTRYCHNQLTVSLTLRFCNKYSATAPATALETAHAKCADICFQVTDPNFKWCKLTELRNQNGRVEYSTCNPFCWPSRTEPDEGPNNLYHCQTRCIDFRDLNLAAGDCAEIDVVIQANDTTISHTNPDGTISNHYFLEYLKKYQVLEASVKFCDQPTITRRNELLDSPHSTTFDQVVRAPRECVTCEGFCFSFWHFLIPSIIIIALIAVFWRRRRILQRAAQA